MAAGIGLNDKSRQPWLLSLRKLLLKWHNNKESGVLACSALKDSYRHLLNSRLTYMEEDETCLDEEEDKTRPISLNILFVLLNVVPELIEQRLARRANHPVVNDNRILKSQFQTLEIPNSAKCVNVPFGLPICLSVERSEVSKGGYYFANIVISFEMSTCEITADVKKIVSWIIENNQTF